MVLAIIYFSVLLLFWFFLRDELKNSKNVEKDED